MGVTIFWIQCEYYTVVLIVATEDMEGDILSLEVVRKILGFSTYVRTYVLHTWFTDGAESVMGCGHSRFWDSIRSHKKKV